MRYKKIDWPQFIKIYMDVYEQGGGIRDLSAVLNLPENVLYGRIYRGRKAGIAFPPFTVSSRQLSKIEIKNMNGIISRSNPLLQTKKKAPEVQ